MWSSEFWKAAFERAAKTFVQVLLASLTATLAIPTKDAAVAAVGLAAVAAGYSLLSSLLSVLQGDPASPSLVSAPPGAGDRRLG